MVDVEISREMLIFVARGPLRLPRVGRGGARRLGLGLGDRHHADRGKEYAATHGFIYVHTYITEESLCPCGQLSGVVYSECWGGELEGRGTCAASAAAAAASAGVAQLARTIT